MTERPPTRVKKKDRTGAWISIGAHVGVIVIALFILSRTELGRQLKDSILGTTRADQKRADKPKPPPAQPRAKGPKAAPDAPPPAAGRRSAADAPPPAGESFVVDDRTKSKGPAGGSAGGTNVQRGVPPPPPPKLAPLKLFSSAPPKSDIKQLFAERSKEAASVEAFGSEQISKTGVSDAGAIVKNISGTTIVDGKFAVIRGLSDRYVTTTFNGAEIPSADPYRRAASLDLFPAQVIDKVVVAKTFTPDQQGSYTGGGINIVSKSFPERSFANLSIGSSHNSQSTGNKNFLTYDGGGRDWLGMDDGTRALPSSLAKPGLALNQGVYTTANPNSPVQPPFAARVANNDSVDQATRALGTAQFAPHRSAPVLNHSFSTAAGDTTHLLGRPFGVFASMNYRRDFTFYEDAVSRRYEPADNPGEFELGSDYSDTRASEIVNWAGMVNLAYQILPDHELGFSFLYNQNSDKQARQQQGFSNDDPSATYFRNRLQWTERNLSTFQLKGAHRISQAAGIKLDWIAALSGTTQEEPDTRFFNYALLGDTYEIGRAGTPDPKQPTRYFRELSEDNRNEKIDLVVPFRQWHEREGEFKFGLFESISKRTSVDREFFYQGGSGFNGEPNSYLTPANLGFTATTNANQIIRYTWNRYAQNRDSAYEADSAVRAAYAMADGPLVSNLRLVAGVRLESTEMTVDSRSYLASAITGTTTNSSNIQQTDYLPALGLIWSVTSNMNVRAHYSHTVARPSFRELAAYRSYDPVLDEVLEGNPLLTMSAIVNYDLRWEWFPRPGEIVSASLFYKDIENAIERSYVTIDQDIVSFINRPTAKVWGFELEVRKGFDFIHPQLKDFTLGGSVSLIFSDTKLLEDEYDNKKDYVPDVEKSRSLYDQSPYILNLDFTYDSPRTRTTASLLLNVAGPRIVIAGITTEDVYEQPAPTLDFVISQKIGRHLTARFTARNLLNPKIERTYGKDSDLLYSSYRRGLTFGLSLGYEF